MTLHALFKPRRRHTPPNRDQWHRFVHVNGAVTCCSHCTPTCSWLNWHPHPCTECIKAMEASPPLRSCLADTDGRCITCAELHGVRITHRGAA